MHYNGASIIETRPLEDKKHFKYVGKFRYSTNLPISLAMLINQTITQDTTLDILSNMQNIKLHIHNASLEDLTNNTKIIDNTNLDLMLATEHHRTYKNLEELVNDIPQNYNINVSIHSQNISGINTTISPSIIYGFYIPFDINYTLKATLHTDATKFSTADILSHIELRDWESSMSNDFEESSTKINFNASLSKEDMKCDINTLSQIKIKPTYAKHLDEGIKKFISLIPASAASEAQSAIRQLDLTALDLDTHNDPISIALKGNVVLADKTHDLVIDIPHLGMSFHDISFDIKNTTNLNVQESGKWSSVGVISAHQYEALIKYFIDGYFAIYHLPENREFNNVFYFKTFSDFSSKIANNITHDNTTITVEYDIQPDVTKSRLGKFSWIESTLLYYSTLLQHITAMSKDSDEAVAKFKTIVPDYVSAPESLEKIMIQSQQ